MIDRKKVREEGEMRGKRREKRREKEGNKREEREERRKGERKIEQRDCDRSPEKVHMTVAAKMVVPSPPLLRFP